MSFSSVQPNEMKWPTAVEGEPHGAAALGSAAALVLAAVKRIGSGWLAASESEFRIMAKAAHVAPLWTEDPDENASPQVERLIRPPPSSLKTSATDKLPNPQLSSLIHRRGSQSAPTSPSSPFGSPATRRKMLRRTQSHDIQISRRYNASISIKRPAPDAPRQVQLTIVWNYRQTVFTASLSRLLFWCVLLLFLLVPASGLKITPTARFLVSHGGDHTVRVVRTLPSASDLSGKELVEPMIDELNHVVMQEAKNGGIPLPLPSDDSGYSNFATELARFVASGEISFGQLRAAAGRACISAAIHKMVGAALASDVATDIATCVMHASPHA